MTMGTVGTVRMLTRAFLIAVVFAVPFLGIGCDGKHIAASLGSSSKPYQEYLEDPATLTTIKTVAIFPFDDCAPQPGFNADEFANKLANQLAAHGKVRVLYPRDILDRVERENRDARRHNAELKERVALGLITEQDAIELADGGSGGKRPYFDPVKNPEEAVRLARRAKADAVIIGSVSDYDPYMRPRLSLTMRLIATGSTETAATAIAELTQWGIPMSGSGGASGGGTIYIRQQSFDSSFGNIGMDVSKYGWTHHTDSNAYGTEMYIRSMSNYYDVVSAQLAQAFATARRKAILDAEERAKKKAREDKSDEKKAVARLLALMERDSRIPDHESSIHGEGYWDQAFPDKGEVVRRNGDDRRIMSWRPEGKSSRRPTHEERYVRDSNIPENERGRALEGYSAMVDSGFPDADTMMEMNMGDNRDRSWRPDHYFRANPRKAVPLYAPGEFRGEGEDY